MFITKRHLSRRTVLRGPDLNCSFALDKQKEARYASCSRELDGTRTAVTLYVEQDDDGQPEHEHFYVSEVRINE